MNETKGRYWVTKYACTKGIYEVEGEKLLDGYLSVQVGWQLDFLSPNEFCETREKAEEVAEMKREAKLASLKKQIENLCKPLAVKAMADK